MNHQHNITGNSIAHLAAKVRRAFSNRLNRNFRQAGLDVTVEQFVVLMILRQAGELSQQEIAVRSNRDKTSVTRLLKNIEKKCLIRRRCGINDKRQKLICLSKTGKILIEKIITHAEIYDDIAEKGISQQELMICRDVLKKMYSNLAGVEND